jgi:drug/metabolite transporter (DMT)-like permease
LVAPADGDEIVLLATWLALGSAVLHAGWNVAAKRAEGDRFVVFWAQFAVSGALAAVVLIVYAATAGMPASGYGWAALSGLVHLPYLWLLALAYTHGDFSVSYPLARGGGAALAAALGVAVLGDHLTGAEMLGVAVIVGGLCLLSSGATRLNVVLALAVALTIGIYTTIDAHGSRSSGALGYVVATFVATAGTLSVAGVASGRTGAFIDVVRHFWRRAFVTGVAALVTYGMVLAAVRYAPVGYVAALRESSVVLGALAGWRLFGESDHGRRVAAASVVLAGLLTLVATGV